VVFVVRRFLEHMATLGIMEDRNRLLPSTDSESGLVSDAMRNRSALVLICVLVAQVLQSCSRRIDVVARHGGDEFMVILPGSSLSEAHRFFERMRRQVTERSGRTLGLDLRLSAGAVQCPGYSTDPATLLDAADEAMYRAKRRGKNRMFATLSLAPAEHRRAFRPEE
jgi:predicted signal transduction protein with EAL and GGDEF domain